MWSISKVALGCALVSLGSAAAADMLVVRVIGAAAGKYRPGQMLPASTRVTLGATDQLVLLDAKGTKTLRGPGTFPISGPGAGAAAPTRLAAIAGTDTRRARVGAVRAPGALPPARPNIWYLDAGAAGATCLPEGTRPELWRAGADVAGTTTIAGSGGTAEVAWIKGQTVQPWPANLPVADGARYTLRGVGAENAGTAIEVKRLAAPPAALPEMAKALIAAGCSAQLDLLIATATPPAVEAAPITGS